MSHSDETSRRTAPLMLIVGGTAAIAALVLLYASLASASRHAQGLAAFEAFSSVFQNPRCLNCHRSDMPRVRNDARTHVPRVRPGDNGAGVGGERCWICHRDENNARTNIPGAPGWRMPPYLMSWDGLESADVCANITDPKYNGGRDLKALHEHFREDHLIAWAWSPGGQLATPPMPYDVFLSDVSRWIELGAPCPE